MKLLQYYKILFLFICSSGILPVSAYTQDGGGLHWDYSGSNVQRSTDGSKLDVTLTIQPIVKPEGQEVVCIYPVYVSSDGKKSLNLEPVCISGETRYKVMKRRKALHNQRPGQPDIQELHSIKDLKEGPLTVRKSLPFELWMADGYIMVEERLYGCAECGVSQNRSHAVRVNIPIFGEKYYAYDFAEPKKALAKCYEEAFDCKIKFPVARYDLQKIFENNEQELKRLEIFISESLKIKGAKLKEVHIKGYSSPEGDFNYNKKLAERRVQTLSGYVTQRYPELKKVSVYQVVGVGEDWTGLEDAVKLSSLSNREEVLSAINRYSSDRERETAIRNLDNSKSYDKLLKDFFPGLRRTTFRLQFDVSPYTAEEIPEIFVTKPECLSQHEMYQLANLYDDRRENPIEIYEKAYRQFSPDAVAILNYANALLKYEKDADGALKVLEVVRDDIRCLFPMAIAYSMKGNWRRAEELLMEAANNGNIYAKEFYHH